MTDPAKLSDEDQKRLKIVKAYTAMMIASFAEKLDEMLAERFKDPATKAMTGDVQVGLAVLAWPMVRVPGERPDGRPNYAAEGEAFMVGNVPPDTDPDNVMVAMMESALRQIKDPNLTLTKVPKGLLRPKPPTKH